MKDKQIPLMPEIKEVITTIVEQPKKTTSDISLESILAKGDGDSDSFFRSVVDDLKSSGQIDTKTELLDTGEVFAVTKLDFLSKVMRLPMLAEFTHQLKVNRVSLKRAGRTELIAALIERRQEEEREERKKMRGMLGI